MPSARWQPLIGAVGAETAGIDVRAEPADSLLSALWRHQVLVIRDQQLSPEELEVLAARLGSPQHYPYAAPLSGTEFVVAIRKEAADRHNFGGAWHSDTSYLVRPPSLTLLYAVTLPREGGDTLFADMYGACDALSEGLRSCLSALVGVNTSSLVHAAGGSYASVAGDHGGSVGETTTALHPVLRRHPETGRLALYVSLVHTERFDGMSRPESLPLLEYLQAAAVRPENTSRVRWRPGTLAIWDNRCVQHLPLNDYPGETREMHRVIVEGEEPLGPLGRET